METYFGKHNWITIFLLKINISYQVRTIRFLVKSIKSPDRNAILEGLSDIELLRMKHQLFLDAIMKAEICTESLLVAIDAMSNDPEKIAETLTFYPPIKPHQVIDRIRSKAIDIRKAFLLLPAKLNEVLTNEEKSLIEQLSMETEQAIYRGLEMLADLYEKYYIVYMKSKHGLTIETGSGINTGKTVPPLSESLIYVHDNRKKREDLPKDHRLSMLFGFGPSSWFNTVSIVTTNDKLEKDLLVFDELLLLLTNYLVDNHLGYLSNCGENFLPYDITSPNTIQLRYLGDNRDLTADEHEKMTHIQEKMLSVLQTPKLELLLNRNFHDEEISRSLKAGPVTTLWTGD
jgi:hypothetical protein